MKLTQFRTRTKFGRTDLLIDSRTTVSEAASRLALKLIKALEEKENVDIISTNELANLQTDCREESVSFDRHEM